MTTKDDTIRKQIKLRGLRVERSGSHGYRVFGYGVDILTADINLLTLRELEPQATLTGPQITPRRFRGESCIHLRRGDARRP